MLGPRLAPRDSFRGMRRRHLWLALLFLWVSACTRETRTDPAVEVVAASLGTNKRGIEASVLRSLPNPKGEGTFVYVPKADNDGSRNVIWLVIDGQAYPLNGATKGTVTPMLPWPREAAPGVWQRTGLDPYWAAEAVEIVFGPQ